MELEHLYGHTNNHWRFSAPPNSEWQSQLEQWKTIEVDIPANHTTQLTHTLDALECGEAPLVTGQQARNIVEFLTSFYKSAFTRQPVTRGAIDPNDPFYYHVYGAEKPGRNVEVNTSGIG